MGNLGGKIGTTFKTMAVATLAIAGIPPLAGFFSKDEILWRSWLSADGSFPYLWLIGFVTALMTAFYMGRLLFLTFYGQPRMSHDVEHHVHESPKSMTVPLVILAFFSFTAGWLGWPGSLGGSNHFEHFLEPVFSAEPAHEQPVEGNRGIEYGLMLLSIGAAVAGGGLAWRSYGRAGKDYSEPIAATAPPLYNTLLNKFYVDEAYDYAFTGRRKVGSARLGVMGLGEASSWFDAHIVDGLVNGAGWLTRLISNISKWWDKWIIDGLCVNGPAMVARMLSYPARALQWGLVQWYALVMVLGLVGFVFYYAWR